MRVTRAELTRTRRPRPRRERDVQAAIRDALLRTVPGVVVVKYGSGGFRVGNRYVKMGRTGVADLLAVLPPNGRTLAVEVKRVGAKPPSDEQFNFLEGVRQAGGIGIVAYSVDDVLKALR